MKIKVKDKEFSFEGYVNPINSVQRVAELCYEQGRAELIDGIDKIIQFIKDNSLDYKLEYDSFKVVGSSVVICLLEGLKEQKNE